MALSSQICTADAGKRTGSFEMDVLYLQSDKVDALGAPLLAKRKYDRLYTDTANQTEGLCHCLKSLASGDTLYVERESCLADSMVGAAGILRHLADMGVNVWCERSGKLIEAKTSPFKNLSLDAAQALIDFRNAFSRLRQEKGVRRARSAGKSFGRTRIQLPECFASVCHDWFEKKISIYQAAGMCEMSVTTFWKHAKELEKAEAAATDEISDVSLATA